MVVVVVVVGDFVVSYHRQISLIVRISFASSFNAAGFVPRTVSFGYESLKSVRYTCLVFSIKLYTFGDRLATFLRNNSKML